MCRTIEIRYSGDNDDLDDEAKKFLGTYDYLGILMKNDAAIYNHTYEQKLHNGHAYNRIAYLVKDWKRDDFWKVVVTFHFIRFLS